jgi:hypothetical protein
VEVPHLRGIDAMPRRGLAGREQVQDRGHSAAAAALADVPEGLAEVTALGMGLELEPADDLGRV